MVDEPSPLIWEDGAPRSALYGDIYFSLQDGLAESRAVFLEGCGLPNAWRGRPQFTVGELGFGSGLNIVALIDLWRREKPADGRLHIFSLEAHPLDRADAARALAAWPELTEIADALLARWPGKRRGFYRIELPQFAAILDVAVMEAAQALDAWAGRADAWFLDGFSPAMNPAMWRREVLALIAARSAPDARAATFTVAGEVRRGLEAVGFSVEKRPGHGRKRERLEARLGGQPAPAPVRPGVVILGAGIAGASLARAFTALGCPVRVLANPSHQAASGNPAALVTPALDAGGGTRAALYAEAFARAAALYDEAAVITRGALQIETDARDGPRYDKVAAQTLFEPGGVERLDPAAVAGALDEPQGKGGLRIAQGLVVDPATVCEAWLGEVTFGVVQGLRREARGWTILLADGGELAAEVVIIASGYGAAELAPDLGLLAVRGQASFGDGPRITASAFGAYAIPTRSGVLFGATHDRGDAGTEVRPADHARNLAALAKGRPRLAAAIDPERLEGRAAIRATVKDRLPVAGEIAPGLYVLGALGSRGFTTAPLLAEHIAALVMGAPSPLQGPLADLVSPARLKP